MTYNNQGVFVETFMLLNISSKINLVIQGVTRFYLQKYDIVIMIDIH